MKPLESGSTRCPGKEAVGEKWWEKLEHLKMDYHVPCVPCVLWPIAEVKPPPIVAARWIWWPPSCGAGPEHSPPGMVLNKCVHMYTWIFICIYIYILYICTYVHMYITYITLHYTTLHYIALHCIALPYIQMHTHIDIYTYTCLQHNWK